MCVCVCVKDERLITRPHMSPQKVQWRRVQEGTGRQTRQREGFLQCMQTIFIYLLTLKTCFVLEVH